MLLVRGLVRQPGQPERGHDGISEVHAGSGGGGVERRHLSETPGPEARTPIATRTAGGCAGNILLGVPDLLRQARRCAVAALQALGDVLRLRGDEQ